MNDYLVEASLNIVNVVNADTKKEAEELLKQTVKETLNIESEDLRINGVVKIS